ncbi:uncharacterized protein LOC113005941 [Solenopsis invicta]|uniref:uncharacterized protein LOC113005941 n=1 Tax=Solenopsis invicta TaxID=13686 RepID=UPI00193DD3FC|nr:uncharacterized protein LOC113005941 [Solenopsis invicta]
MADEETRKILKDLKLENLIENFEKNKITKDTLEHLSEAIISELIPIIGQRVIFLSYWKKHFNITRQMVESSPTKKRMKLDDEKEIETLINLPDLSNENPQNNCTNDFKQSMINLKDLLLKYKIGQQILNYYERENQLQENFRNKLCDIIINDIENKNAKLTNDLAECLSKNIINTFPTEVATTYEKNSVIKKSMVARGKLMNMWRNRCTLYKKFETKLKKEENEKENNAPQDIDQKVQDSMKWLDENVAPWELVLQHWLATFDIRRKHINNFEEKTLHNLLNRWSVLKHPQGYQLIVQDFDTMNLSKVKLDLNIWQQFVDVIIKHSTCNIKNDEVNLMLQKLRNKDISDDTKVAIGLMLLPHLIPPKGLKKYKGKYYKPSIANAKESLIKHASIPGDMILIRQEARKRAEMLNLMLQPYIVILGSLDEVKETYIQVDDILYKANSTLEAIDVCFKIYHVFQSIY